MRRALVILSVVAAIAGEAPYHLPRPAQSFNYPSAPAPPTYVHQHLAPASQFPPQQQFIPNFGYNYQAPIQSPQYIQLAPQQPQGPVHSHPPHPPPPAQHHHHHHHHQAPAQVYNPSPAPLPFPVARPQPLPVIQPQPQPIYSQPSQSYGAPQAIAPRAPLQSAPTATYALPVFAPQPAPQLFLQPQPQAQVYQPISYNEQQQQQPQQQQQYSQQQGYNYQQPQALAQYQPQAQPQYQLQAQPQHAQSAPVLSSYQADSHQYSTAQDQTHRDALDSLVVNRVQNIITDNEHSVARNAGYQSLVSGVSLEQAKPSVEITSFVHTAPLVTSSGGSSEGIGSSSFSVASSAASPSVDYGVPAPDTSQSAESGASFNFLPQNKPAISYGPPN